MNVQPLHNRLIVKRIQVEDTTPGGIVIPDAAKEQPQEGEVLAIGPGRVNEATGQITTMTVSVGDKILFSKYAGTEITLNDESHLILSEDDVLVILR